jgi:hypothetical protein
LPTRSCYQTPGRGRARPGRPVSNALADQAAKELGVSRSLVYRLVARYRQRAQTSSLLSVLRGRIERTQWLDKEVETLIGAAVERIYLQREQPGDAVGSRLGLIDFRGRITVFALDGSHRTIAIKGALKAVGPERRLPVMAKISSRSLRGPLGL